MIYLLCSPYCAKVTEYLEYISIPQPVSATKEVDAFLDIEETA